MLSDNDRKRLCQISQSIRQLSPSHQSDVSWLITLVSDLSQVRPLDGRTRLPITRKSITHKFSIMSSDDNGDPSTKEFFLTVGLYKNGNPGEIFFRWSLRSDDVSIMMDQWALEFSMLLQHGVPIESLCNKFIGVSCKPSGPVTSGNKDFKIFSCSSPFDYVAKYLIFKFAGEENEDEHI